MPPLSRLDSLSGHPTSSHDPISALARLLEMLLSSLSLTPPTAPNTVQGLTTMEPDGQQVEVILTLRLPIAPASAQLTSAAATDSALLHAHVERALKDYHHLARLAQSPLVALLPASEAACPAAAGRHLQRALDNAIERLLAGGNSHSPEQYLHLRYREGVSHKDIAARWGYTERHLHRLRHELIAAVAMLLIPTSA